MIGMLPACEYRLPTTVEGKHYCLSTQVWCRGNVVSNVVCRRCNSRIDTDTPQRRRPDSVPVPLGNNQMDLLSPVNEGDFRWCYGITTSLRAFSTLGRTLASLSEAGFGQPHLFADGPCELPDGYDCTVRQTRVGAWTNWWLAALELFGRDPYATAYALFQDDILLARNLRQSLEQIEWPVDGYLNLYTSMHNDGAAVGWSQAPSPGRGALALVLRRETLKKLLLHPYTLEHRLTENGHKRIDVAIQNILESQGIAEYIHCPSLVQHQTPETGAYPNGMNSTLGHDYGAESRCFAGESFDCLQLLEPSRSVRFQVSHMSQPRIGLIGFNTATGIGSCNRALARHLKVDSWLIVPHGSLPDEGTLGDVPVRRAQSQHDHASLVEFLRSIDVVVSVETEFIRDQVRIAKSMGKFVVCVPMVEWLPTQGWPNLIDLYLCPTAQSAEVVSGEQPGRCQSFPWPVDVASFAFRHRHVCETFVFVNGQGGHAARKGGDVVRQTAEMLPDIPIIVYDQTNSKWPASCQVRGAVTHSPDLYRDGDVLLLPARFNGIGLEQLEAMSSGMPVIATDAAPMNELACLDLVDCRTRRESSKRPRKITVAEPVANHLAALMKKWHHQPIGEQSLAARTVAESRAWSRMKARFVSTIQKEMDRRCVKVS
jgi:hypothetical protein